MATRNLLVKDFKLVRQPGQTVTYPVNVPEIQDPPEEDTTEFGGDSLPESGSITTAQCLNYGGVPINGQCTLTTNTSGGNIIRTYRISD